jgi:predicted tellurium resistance membrane protein TerC
VVGRFRYLKTGLSVVLVFVGLKMIGTDVYKLPIAASLAIIVAVLGASIAASMLSVSSSRPEPQANRRPPAANS